MRVAAERPLYSELMSRFLSFFYSEPVIREYAHVTRIHTAPTEYLKERKKENRQPKGGMGGRRAATTQGF